MVPARISSSSRRCFLRGFQTCTSGPEELLHTSHQPALLVEVICEGEAVESMMAVCDSGSDVAKGSSASSRVGERGGSTGPPGPRTRKQRGSACIHCLLQVQVQTLNTSNAPWKRLVCCCQWKRQMSVFSSVSPSPLLLLLYPSVSRRFPTLVEMVKEGSVSWPAEPPQASTTAEVFPIISSSLSFSISFSCVFCTFQRKDRITGNSAR